MKKLYFVFGAIVFCLLYSSLSMAESDILTTLNGRYKNVVDDCDGKPGYYCSGVMLSVDRTWEDGDSSDESASFSYLRKDIYITDLFNDGTGYIFKDQNTAIAENDALQVYCAYVTTAATIVRPDSVLGPTCGTKLADGTFYNSCSEAGVNSVDTWLSYYYSPEVQMGPPVYQCAFDAKDAGAFLTFIKAHDATPPAIGYYNEVVLEGWHWTEGDKLPIEAFFYKIVNGRKIKMQSALTMRDDYEDKTGIHVPVVGIDFSNMDAPFVDAR